VAVSGDGRTVAAAQGYTGTVWIAEAATARVRHRFSPPASFRVECLAFSPNAKVLAVGGYVEPDRGKASGVVLLYDAHTGKKSHHLEAHPGRTRALTFSPDGKVLATGGDEASIRLWTVKSGKPAGQMRGDNQDHRALAFSPDGKLLAAGGDGGDLTLWDASTREVVRDCAGRAGEIDFVAFTRQGKQIVWAARQSIIRINDTDTADQVARYGDEKIAFNDFALSAEGDLLLTAGQGGMVRFWDLASSHQVTAFRGHPRAVTALAVSTGGKVLVTGGQEGHVLVWRLPDLDRARLRMLWSMLASDAPNEVRQAVERLNHARALPFLGERVRGLVRLSAEIPRLFEDLDSDEYHVRERATRLLTRYGWMSRAPLERLLRSKPSLEVYRRAERILQQLREITDEERSALHALAVLEKLASPEARNLLRDLARARAETPVVREAAAALARLEAREKKPSK
jgi:hypothetical protein